MRRLNPYKLFDYYTVADAHMFFGREAEVSEVVGDILANKLLVLFARSGSGKTSLLNAGIGPALREVGQVDENDPGIQMVTIRLSDNMTPEESALRALRTALGETETSSETLHEFLKRRCTVQTSLSSGSPTGLARPPLGLVLVFDQFEELFISLFRDLPDIRREFAEKLAKIIHDDTLRAYVVLSLRSDHFHHLNEFRSVIPSIFQHNTILELRPFEPDAAIRVIRGPAERPGSGFSWEPGLPERIVEDLATMSDERPRIFPIHLQIVCYDLFQLLAEGEREIKVAHYEGAADASSIAEGKPPADAMIRRRIIGPLEAVKARSRRRWLYRLLRELMTAHGAKFPRSLTGLRKVIPRRHLLQLLMHLRRRLLLRRIGKRPETYYELRHDYLARMIAPWLDDRERKMRTGDLLSRVAVASAAVVLAVVVTKLAIDWFTYTASFAPDGSRPRELLLKRKVPFDFYAPSWWKREISAGYSSKQLLAAGLTRHRFPVSKALWDWKDVEDQLKEQERWALQLATRLDRRGPADATLFEAIQHPDIVTFMLADQGILEHVLSGVTKGDRTVQGSSAAALSRLGGRLPQVRIDALVTSLINELPKSRNASVKSSIISVLGRLTMKLPEDRTTPIVEVLLRELNDPEAEVRNAAVSALARAPAKIAADRIATVAEALARALKDQDLQVKNSASTALESLGEELPQARITGLFQPLLTAVKDSDSYVKSTAISLLGSLGNRLAPDQIAAFGDALLPLLTLKDSDPNATRSALAALAQLGDQLSQHQIGPIVEALLSALKASDLTVKSSAAEALSGLGKTLPEDRLAPVVEALFTALKDPRRDAKSAVFSAITTLGSQLPQERMIAFIDTLLAALKDPNSEIKRSAVAALGRLEKKLPPERTKAVVEALLTAFKDPDADIKHAAVSALARLGSELAQERIEPFVSALLTMVADPDASIKHSAVSAMSGWGDKLPPAQTDLVIKAFVGALKDPDSKVKGSAIGALGTLGAELQDHYIAPIVEALINELKNSDSDVKSSAAMALGGLGKRLTRETTAAAVVAALLSALKDPDENVKNSATAALKRLGETLPQDRLAAFVSALLGVLKEADSGVKSSLLSVLGDSAAEFSPEQVAVVVEALLSALMVQNSEVQSRSLSALGGFGEKLGDHIGAVVEAVFTALKSSDADVKDSASEVLAKLEKKLSRERIDGFVQPLLKALRDLNPVVKRSAISTLASLEEKLPEERMAPIADDLLNALEDTDSEVKSAAVLALGQLGKKLPQERLAAVVEALLASLKKDPDSDVRDSAVEALGVVASRTVSSGGPSVFLDLDLETGEASGKGVPAVRMLAKANWTQSDADLVDCLKSDDSQWRSFALHVLAGRQPVQETRNRILAVRNDPKGPPWVKLAALRCLVEIERERLALEAEQAAKKSDAAAEESPESP